MDGNCRLMGKICSPDRKFWWPTHSIHDFLVLCGQNASRQLVTSSPNLVDSAQCLVGRIGNQ